MKPSGRLPLLALLLLLPASLLSQGNPVRVVVLGSSTAEGCCAPGGQGWADRYRAYLGTTGRTTEVINLGVGGNTTFDILPTDYVSPYRSVRSDWNRPPNPNCNITKALSYNPTHVIINLPSNDVELTVPVSNQLVHYDEIVARARAQGVPVWITTSQPRNFGETQRRMLMEQRDSTFSRYATYAIDFWNGLANADGTIMTAYDYDGTHLNADGHAILYERVRNSVPLDPSSPSSGNVVANGGFEAGTSSWGFYTNGWGSFTSVTGGTEGTKSVKIGITIQGTNVQLSQTGLKIESNTRYQLSFDAYCNTGHDLTVSLTKSVSPYTNYGLNSVNFDLQKGWSRHAISFTTATFGGTVSDGRLMFWLAANDAGGDQYFFDNVVLTRSDAPVAVAPSITAHPANQSVTVGQTATFSVTATGTAPLQYQWQKNSANISGATGSSYTTPAAASADNGSTYCVMVSNSAGNVTSNTATLSVTGEPAPIAPTITSQPQNQTVAVGQTATFSVSATGTAPLSYQWQKNSTNIAGATGASYTTPSTVPADSGSAFRVVVTNAVGNVTSNAAILAVTTTTTQPSPSVLANGGFENGTTSWNFYTNGAGTYESVTGGTEGTKTAKIGISTEGTNVQLHQTGVRLDPNTKYQLSFDAYSTSGHDFSVSLMQNVSPYTNYGLSAAEVNLGTSWQRFSVPFTTSGFSSTVSDGRLMFWLAPYDAAGDQYYIDNIVLAKADAPPATTTAPTITAHPANQTVTVGQTATFSVTATGTAPLSYQWQKNSANISGATGSSYTTPAAATGDNGSTYRVLVSNSAGNVTSNAATLTVSSSGTPSPSTGNVLANGGFEGGTSSWGFYSNGSGTFATVAGGTEGTNAAKIALSAEGTNVQLHQVGVTLESNTKYQLSFDAYCSSGHDLSVSLMKNVSPYTNYGLSSAEFNLGTGWSRHTVSFTTGALGGTVTDGRLMFWLAPYDAAGDEYYFDNVMLTKGSNATAAAATSEEQMADEQSSGLMPEVVPTVLRLHENYPNPFNPVTTIAFDLPSYAYVRVKIYDVLGREVETLLDGERKAGAYRLVWDARLQSSGVYFCRLQVEPAGSEQAGTVLSKKLVLAK